MLLINLQLQISFTEKRNVVLREMINRILLFIIN